MNVENTYGPNDVWGLISDDGALAHNAAIIYESFQGIRAI